MLLSSHLLHEVEMIADDMVLIGRGRIVAQGSKAELLKRSGSLVNALDIELLAKTLAAAGISARLSAGGMYVDAEPADVGRAVSATSVVLTELRPADGAGLEDLFLQLTAEDQRDVLTEGVDR